MTVAPIISKVWSFCNTLRDDGVGYGDYLEQLTYLIFLKMADEYSKPPHMRDVGIPAKYTWPRLKARRRAELEAQYIELLRELGKRKDVLGQMFTKAEQDSGSRQAPPPHRHDRGGAMGHDGRGCQGRHLRRIAGEER